MSRKTIAAVLASVVSTATLTFAQAVPQPVPAAPPPRVEVFAFTPVGDVGNSTWVGRGIQESLQNQVSSSGAALYMASDSATTQGDSIAVAKAAGCNLAVVGTFQVAGGQIRANGHVINVATNATVGGFSATGKQEDLFKVEDALGSELSRLLPPPQIARVAPPALQAAQPVSSNVAGTNVQPSMATDQQLQGPTDTYLPAAAPAAAYVPSTTYVPASTTYYYPDSFAPVYYGYSDPYLYGGIGIGFVGGYYGGFGYYNHGYDGRGREYGYGGFRGGVSGYRGGVSGYRGGGSGYRGGGYAGGGVSRGAVGGRGGGFSAGGHGGGGHR
jgi:TolB-like protein